MDSGFRRNDGFIVIFFILIFWASFAQAQSADAVAALQGRLVQAAADIRRVEYQLQQLEDHLAGLEVKRASLEKEYIARREKTAVAIAALTRMGRTPREAVLIRPGGPLQAARTSMLLSASVPAIESEAASFRTLLSELEKTRMALAEKTTQARAVRSDLSARHDRLTALLNDRSAATPHDFEKESREVAALAHEARSLRDLLSGLDSGQSVPAMVLAPEGDGQLPVSGIIRIRYGQRDDVGVKSSGISIETLDGSVVVAPLGGVVRYAGPFKGYGNIVIIAHKGGYYSLVAGLDKISVSAGQTIVSGEPIAILSTINTTNQNAPSKRRTVYYELRYAGQPVDPSRKLPDLG